MPEMQRIAHQNQDRSAALSAAVVSVEKKGLPVPAANITTTFFVRWAIARLLMYGSATSFISMAVCTLVGMPIASNAS